MLGILLPHSDAFSVPVEPSLKLADRDQLATPNAHKRTSGSICARQVSQDTPSASHACSTLSARAGALRFWSIRVAAVRDEIEAIAVTDPDLPESANASGTDATPSCDKRATDRLRLSIERPCEHAGFARQ